MHRLWKNSRILLKLFAVFLVLGILSTGHHLYNAASASSILNREPIDVVIKYIDLSDPNLKREGIPQIKKDEDNGELRYAVRSVLKNIPWVRKIFIVMPNERVRYFKAPNKIKNKIVYIKDKDLLGFDSASSSVFQFNFWKLKNFGVSKNFILMDDDYFIGQPLNKSDLFYVYGGKVFPYVIYNERIGRGAYQKTSSYYESLKRKIHNASTHSHAGFQYQRMASLMLLYKVFGKNIIGIEGNLTYFPHNAMGENLDDLKEMYDLVKSNYKYANEFLSAKKRTNYDLQQQTLYSFYVLNKHRRRVNKIKGSYIGLSSTMTANYNVPLFCINTGGNHPYSAKKYAQARIVMNKLFPVASRYEKPDLENGIYTIENILSKNKVLGIASASKNNSAQVKLYDKHNPNAQKFKVNRHLDGSYTLTPLCSGKNIEVAGSNANLGAKIWQNLNKKSKSQRWYLIPSVNGTFEIVSAANHMCMDVDNAQTTNGTNIQCWKPNGTDAQKFRFVPVK